MLTCEQRQLIHDDFVKATDFLGTTYRAYEQLIIADPSNRLDHITNWDKALGKVRNCFKCIETCVVSDNYFISVTGLPPAPYPESQPIQSALEWTSPEDLTSHAWLKVDSVNRLLDQPEMYHSSIATSNTSKWPTPRGSTTPVTMATAFHLIEKMPSTLTGAQTMQALNLINKSLNTNGSIIRRPTPMRIVDQPVNKSESSAEQTQDQPVTPVSFASATQVRMDIAVPSPVGQGVPQVQPVWVPPSQITSVASMANVTVSMASQQSGTLATTQPQQQTEQCRKCGKKNHPTSCCHQKVTCRKSKGKDHSAKFCSMLNQEELKCTFCGKTKHPMENCKARKKAEKKIQKELKAKRTSMVTSTAVSTTSSRTLPLSQAKP